MMRPAWRHLPIVASLLLLLTYLLVQSRSPDLELRTHLHEALHAFEIYDAGLTRDVLLARAGLLPHYDPLSRANHGLSQTFKSLRQGSQSVSPEAAQVLSPHIEALDTALQQKLTAVEYFKADNALLRNSLSYVLHTGRTLRREAEAIGDDMVAADIGALSHALLRFLQTPDRVVGEEIAAIIDRLPSGSPFSQGLPLLVAHGRLIVDVLPEVDAQLRQLIDLPTTAHAKTLREAALQYYAHVEARAQIFRWLLYLVAVTLLGYLVALFTRLRGQARDLGRANLGLRREMGEREQAERALRASEERFRAITETANEAIVSADQTGAIVSWNAGARVIFGYEADEVLGTPASQLIPKRYREAHQQAFAQWVGSGRSDPKGRTIEWTGLRKDGQEVPLELSLSTWATAEGLYVTGIMRDLTTRKRLEEQTRQQELQLIQANKMTALGTLVSGVAHEINNPNQLVLMNARVLSDAWQDARTILDAYDQEHGAFWLGGLPYAEMREALPALVHDVHEGARRIERIIDDLRDFARPHHRGAPETFALNQAVQRALRLLTHVIRRKTTRFCIDLAPDVPPVCGDSQQLEQIVVNLVVNALEALPEPERQVTVATRFEPADHCASLSIEDEGVGIASEHLARLCDPFFTTKQESGGTGLGLAITSTLVKAHGGRLTFASELGRGTRALVTLPCADEMAMAQGGTVSSTLDATQARSSADDSARYTPRERGED